MSIWEFTTNSKKKSSSKQTRFFVEFELDFYCLCSLQKSILKSNWFFNFLNSIFRNWKKIKWHSIFQKSSGDRQGVCLLRDTKMTLGSVLIGSQSYTQVWKSYAMKKSWKMSDYCLIIIIDPFSSWFEILNFVKQSSKFRK